MYTCIIFYQISVKFCYVKRPVDYTSSKKVTVSKLSL